MKKIGIILGITGSLFMLSAAYGTAPRDFQERRLTEDQKEAQRRIDELGGREAVRRKIRKLKESEAARRQIENLGGKEEVRRKIKMLEEFLYGRERQPRNRRKEKDCKC